MSGRVRVSVIVATHSRAEYLRDCLRTLAAQETDIGFEVLVIDNASADSTPALLADWCEKDTRFRSIAEPRVGKSKALNTGLSHATGEILLFTDDDVLVDERWVDRWYAFFDRGLPAAAVTPFIAGGMIFPIPDDLEPWPPWMSRDAVLTDLPRVDYGVLRTLGEFEFVWGANFAMTRETYEAMGPWNETLGPIGGGRGPLEDVEYNKRVDEAHGTRWFCPEMIVYHKIRRSHLSPRRLMKTAHYRGRYEYWHEARKDAGRRSQRRSRAIAAHGRNLASWLTKAVAFRMAPSEARFEGTRLAAAAAGYSMQVLRSEERTWLSRGSGRATTLVLNLTGSLMPVLTAPRSNSDSSWLSLDERLEQIEPRDDDE